jgi:cytoskeletal protein RodZ
MTAADKVIEGDNARDGGGFGVFLKSQREARGISLQQVAQRTNIQPEILARLEVERLDQLPEPVYIKGFVKAYAEAIGVDPQEAVLRYERRDAAHRQALSARQIRGRRRLIRRILLVAALVGGVTLAVAAFLPPAPQEAAKRSAAPAVETSAETAPVQAGQGDQRTGPAQADTAPKGNTAAGQPLILTAVGLKEATLKIIVDGKRPKVYRLEVDTRLEIEARREFNILVDDARAVTLYLNGQSVSVPGREGQQVTLQLP